MDSLLVNELAAHYRTRFLRFTPRTFTEFGIGRNSVTLEMGGPPISCIPYEFSVAEARLLAVLNNDEVVHFLGMKSRSSKLILARRVPGRDSPELFHIPVQLEGFQRPNESSNYCLILLRFLRIPHEIKELLVARFFQVDQSDAFVANLKDVPFDAEDVLRVFESVHLSLSGDNTRSAERLKILSYTIKKVQLFGEFSGDPPAVGEKLELHPFQGDADCLVVGTCAETRTYPDLPGFLWLELDQQLSLEVVKKLMKFAKTAKTRYLDPAVKKTPQKPGTAPD